MVFFQKFKPIFIKLGNLERFYKLSLVDLLIASIA